jgi:hypothetical protein
LPKLKLLRDPMVSNAHFWTNSQQLRSLSSQEAAITSALDMLFKHQSLEGRDFLTAFLVLKPIELRNPLPHGTQVLTWRREVL